MGLLDEILKQIEEAQQQAEGRPRPTARPQRRPMPPPRRPVSSLPEREADEDGAEWVEDEEARPSHAPHIPSRRHAEPVASSYAPEPAPHRTVADSAPATVWHAQDGRLARRIYDLLTSTSGLRDAIITREILGTPPGLRRLQRLRQSR